MVRRGRADASRRRGDVPGHSYGVVQAVGSADAATRVLFAAHATVKAGPARRRGSDRGGRRTSRTSGRGRGEDHDRGHQPSRLLRAQLPRRANRPIDSGSGGGRRATPTPTTRCSRSSRRRWTRPAGRRLVSGPPARRADVEACNGCGLAGGVGRQRIRRAGPIDSFASSGVQTVRIQGREDAYRSTKSCSRRSTTSLRRRSAEERTAILTSAPA